MVGRLSKMAQKAKEKNLNKDSAPVRKTNMNYLPGDEPENESEIFYNDKLKHTYFSALKTQSLPCQDEILNQQYEADCLL